MKEAFLYEKMSDKKVKCGLCPHFCVIAEEGVGICGVRENQNGTLYTLIYDKIAAANVDPIEKKPLFHFLPDSLAYSIATAGCNFRCLFCQNWEISQTPKEKRIIYGEEASPGEIVNAAIKSGCRSIAYTYTEPTIFFELAYDCARLAREKGLRNIFVTNGFMSAEALKMIAPYLDAANVDLKSFSDGFYRKVCGARLAPVLETLKMMKKLGIWMEVTTLLIPELNDSEKELGQIADFIRNELGADVPWHVSAFFPAYKMTDRPPTPASRLGLARKIGLEAGLKYVYAGNIRLEGAENTYCGKCKMPLIERSGFRVNKNNLKDAACPFCGEKANGIFN